MDPISHGLIGMAVSASGQSTFSILNPITIASVAGSLIPDGDIILKAWGGSFYLKHHRGVSHSLIAISVEAAVIGLVLKIFYPSAEVLHLFLWAFIGALTHIASDILNSYGAKVFWPFSNKKKSLSLLTLTDPVLIIISLLSILSSYNGWGYNRYLIAIFLIHLMSKIAMRIFGYVKLKNMFCDKYQIEEIHLLPSMIAGHKLRYIINDPLHNVVGDIDFLLNRVSIFSVFKRVDRMTREYILESKTARFFDEFTPIFHVNLEKVNGGYKALLTDLRYILGGKFLHHATILYDKNMKIIEEKFNPYNINKKLDV